MCHVCRKQSFHRMGGKRFDTVNSSAIAGLNWLDRMRLKRCTQNPGRKENPSLNIGLFSKNPTNYGLGNKGHLPQN